MKLNVMSHIYNAHRSFGAAAIDYNNQTKPCAAGLACRPIKCAIFVCV